MRRFRSTKIIATLGPASSSPELIEKLFLSGVDLFRLNFSHGTHEDHAQNYKYIRELEDRNRRPIGIIQDLQGPKLRLGNFVDGRIALEKSQTFILDLNPMPGSQKRVCFPHPEIYQALREGTDILLNDGQVRLKVTKWSAEALETEVVFGDSLSNHKGVNIPNVTLPIEALTEKDRADLEFGLNLGVDLVALSFVQTASDIKNLRTICEDKVGIIAKIEKPLAVQHLNEIVQLSDAVMVARGDLGVEMHPEDVPSIQKEIVRTCRAQGKPVIVATQMLESMVHNPTPTRAEASDVASAVYDGADVVMLSAETASGEHPVETVVMMNRIIERVEGDQYYRRLLDAHHPVPEPTASDAITAAARKIADTLSLKAIVTVTTSGTTTLRASRERPNAPLIALTSDYLTAHMLTLAWGVHAIYLPMESDFHLSFSQLMNFVNQAVLMEGFARKGDEVLVTVGAQFTQNDNYQVFTRGSTRGLYILNVQENFGQD